MAKREKLRSKAGHYFDNTKSELEFISSGCKLLDCVLAGGYPVGRIVNIVGDKSTGKTLLAIEAAANFAAVYEDGLIWYAEVESAFDKGYAYSLGIPIDRVEFVDGVFSVEDMFEDLEDRIQEAKKADVRGLYILDSLDALSDRSELSRDIDAGTYGAEKAKKMSQLFRRLVQQLGDSRILVMIISQVRDKIGVTFGAKTSRSGGRALDFYASQVLRLSQVKEEKKTINKIVRTVGVKIRAKCEKNKIGLPFRICEFPILFAYGIDDLTANGEWLIEIDRFEDAGFSSGKKLKRFIRSIQYATEPLLEEDLLRIERIADTVQSVWKEIETGFLPKRRKY